MTRTPKTGAKKSGAHRAIRSITLLVVGLAGFGIAALTGLAVARSVSTLGVEKNVTDSMLANKKVTIVVSKHGLPVYELLPETTHHALCTKANQCFSAWLPVKVASKKTKLTAAHGMKGKLGTWHRDGFYQVTLAGHPLYTFVGDTKKNVAHGDTLKSFGGEWHLIVPTGKTTSAKTNTAPTANTTPANTTPTNTTPTNTMPTYTTPTNSTPTNTTPTNTTPTTPYYPPY